MSKPEEFTLRTATPKDFNHVIKWIDEQNLKGEDTFYVNKRIIERTYSSNNLDVLIENSTSNAIAYAICSEDSIEVFEVKASHRKKHIGKIFVQMLLDRFSNSECIGLKNECVLKSQKFWESVGFKRLPGYEENNDHNPLRFYFFKRSKKFAKKKSEGKIQIQLESMYKDNPYLTIFETEYIIQNGKYILRNDFVTYRKDDYPVIKVSVDNQQLFKDPPKYLCDNGVEKCGYFIRIKEIVWSEVRGQRSEVGKMKGQRPFVI